MNETSNESIVSGKLADAPEPEAKRRDPAVVLRCAAVRCRCDWAEANLDLVIRQGEFHFAAVSADVPAENLTRCILGLEPIESGEVFFRRWQWHQLSLIDQFAARFQMARIVDTPAWVQNLQLRENILWPMLHQGVPSWSAKERLDESIATMSNVSKSRSWAALMLRLRRSLTMRPAFVSETVLRMSQWLRCMSFRPECVLAVRPMRDLPAENIHCFARCARKMANAGTAWLWLDATTDAIRDEVKNIVTHPSPFRAAADAGTIK